MPKDDIQHVVEVMGHPTGEPSHGLHLLHESDPLPHLPLGGYIPHHAKQTHHLSPGITDWGSHRFGDELRPVLPHMVYLVGFPPVTGQGIVPYPALLQILLLIPVEYAGAESDDLFGFITEDSGECWVHLPDYPLVIGIHNCVGNGTKYLLKLCCDVLVVLLRQFPVRHILHRACDPHHPACLVGLRCPYGVVVTMASAGKDDLQVNGVSLSRGNGVLHGLLQPGGILRGVERHHLFIGRGAQVEVPFIELEHGI